MPLNYFLALLFATPNPITLISSNFQIPKSEMSQKDIEIRGNFFKNEIF